jgi:hypothetical protein
VINGYIIWVEKPEGNRLLERLKDTWQDNIKIHLIESGMMVWRGLI